MVQNTQICRIEIPYGDPVELFSPFSESPFAQLYHSCPGADGGGRYSFLMLDPFDYLISKDQSYRTRHSTGQGSPFQKLKSALNQYAVFTDLDEDIPFCGGAAGLFSYDLLHHLEQITPRVEDDLNLPDMCLGFYDAIVAFDHAQQSAWIFSTGLPERNPIRRLGRAQERAEWLKEKIGSRDDHHQKAALSFKEPRSNLTQSDYEARVQTAIDHIYSGDIYQANLSQRFEVHAARPIPAYDVFTQLLTKNPVSFAAYCRFPDFSIASISPERFLRIAPHMGTLNVETKPIKGTRPRGQTPEQDKANRQELLASAKDRAENTMIVDLLRNDLSKFCVKDSVEVKNLCEVETYAFVHHLVSTISGALETDKDAVDALMACFPGGSITGAPKVRAMEIIAELEGLARGPYCGSIGYMGFNGHMDSNIAIRTLVMPHNAGGQVESLYYQVGGGIVADSDPEMEYDESLAKAKAFFELVKS